MFSIKEAGECLKVSPYTLRYYEKEGIIQGIQRDHQGNRVYSEDDLQGIYLILCLKESGMALGDINTYITYIKEGESTLLKRYEMILTQKNKAVEAMDKMQERIGVLENKLAYYSKLINNDGDTSEDWKSLKFDMV